MDAHFKSLCAKTTQAREADTQGQKESFRIQNIWKMFLELLKNGDIEGVVKN